MGFKQAYRRFEGKPIQVITKHCKNAVQGILKRKKGKIKMLTLGSLFDGICGWLLSAQRSGIKPIWSSEIEKFPMAVTAYHFPEVKQMGDISALDGAALPPVDIICAGSPCQDLSVAYGKGRKGLKGERSGLFAEAVRIIRQMRIQTGGVYPKMFVWENVPGVLSSNAGMDFCYVIESLTGCEIPVPRSGKWANAGMVRSRQCYAGWRVLNSKYFGVPQIRKRVFFLADFRARGNSIAEVLFECKEMQADIGKRERNGGGNPRTLENCTRETGEQVRDEVYDISFRMDVVRKYSGHTPTLGARMGTGGNNIPIVLENTLLNTGGSSVRRLTPLECERVQGLPDNWTYLPDNKLCSNAVRYKAVGNGMAQPCSDWILKRIAEVEREDKNE